MLLNNDCNFDRNFFRYSLIIFDAVLETIQQDNHYQLQEIAKKIKNQFKEDNEDTIGMQYLVLSSFPPKNMSTFHRLLRDYHIDVSHDSHNVLY
jgi:hypothetical protein